MKKLIYALCGASVIGYASTILGSDMMTFGSPGFFDLYFIPFLLFYITYFIDKYFFRLFLSISKTRAALGAGIINALCAVVVGAVLYFFAHLSLNESICFMSIADIYCLARFQFQAMPLIPFAGAFGTLLLVKLFIFMNVFEEKKSWIMPLIVLIVSRAAMFGCVYYLMRNLHIVLEYLLNYMPISAVMIVIVVALVLFDVLCSLLFSTKDEEF